MGIIEHTKEALRINVEISRALMELKHKAGSASGYLADLIPDIENLYELQRKLADHLSNID